MIFTRTFVYVHEPKTGGTFVTSMLFRLYGLRWTRFTHLRKIILGSVSAHHPVYGELVDGGRKHGGCREIPTEQRGKKVLATVRNPYDQYVSQYEFGWWKRRECLPYLKQVPNFEKDYPSFPRISFEQYVRLSDAAFERIDNSPESQSWGIRTREFINFYFREPARTVERLTREPGYVASQAYLEDMFDLHFLRTNELNRGLYSFLVAMGYDEHDVSFVLDQERILPGGKGRTDGQPWQSYYTPELKQRVMEREHLLFTLFPEFDV